MKKNMIKFLKKIKFILKNIISVFKFKKIVPIYNSVDDAKLLGSKVALVTGGSGGIGFAISKEYIAAGCKVVIAGTNENKLKKCCKELGDESAYVLLNLTDVNSFKECLKQAVDKFGKIDILVNSAGIHSTKMINDFLNVTEEEYDSIMEINLKGTYFFSQNIANYMIENKIKGHILNISSSTALEPAWSPYRLSKWGIKGLTLGMAQQLTKHGIVVNAIAPGSTATALLGFKKGDSIYTEDNIIGRYIMPEEVAKYAKLLVSDLGNMVLGDTIYISGGRGIFDIR